VANQVAITCNASLRNKSILFFLEASAA